MEYNRSYRTKEDVELIVGQKIKGVFLWMVIGIMCTIMTSFFTLTSQSMLNIVSKGMIPIVIAEFALVMFLSTKVYTMDVNKSRGMFLLYSVLNGMTLSVIAFAYTGMSIVFVFGFTVLLFTIMAIYGYVTNEDLSKFGGLLKGGLVTVIVLTLLNMFLKLPMLYLGISYLGVLLFIALIGYDVNRIKNNMVVLVMAGEDEVIEKVTIVGALALYLDFINLFLYLLRIFGKRK